MPTATCHSEYGRLLEVILHPPENSFQSSRQIASQWKDLGYRSPPDFELAVSEYARFRTLLLACGAREFPMPSDQTTSIDALYCRDAALPTDFGWIIGRMGKKARMPENERMEAFIRKQGWPVLGRIREPGTLEGGDLAWLDQKTLLAGISYRSNPEGIAQLRSILKPHGVTVMDFHLPHYRGPQDVFHLMSLLSPVDERKAVVYAPLLPIPLRKLLLDRDYLFVEVSEPEWSTMACNVLAIAPGECLLLEGNPCIRDGLLEAGCIVHPFSGHAICLPGGGGPTCLTRPMLRESKDFSSVF